ncbi:MAG: DUF1573 domain-containing protein [Pirellulales bacterium]
MKARYVVIASALAGAVLGVGITWADFGHAPPVAIPAAIQAPKIGQQVTQPKLVVDTTLHDFGSVEDNSTVSHAFRFTNIGTATLTLKPGSTTCTACTFAEMSKSQVAPGETVDVVVQYTATSRKPDFKQIATVLTNDPEQQRVELNIRGDITSKFRMLPNRLVMSNVSAKETATAELRIYCFLSDEVRVVEHEFLNAESASLFEFKSEPIARDQFTEPTAKSGCRVLVTLKPGLPLGPFRQTIRLTVETGQGGDPTTSEMSIEGVVVSDLSIVGPGWRSASGVLTIGNVNGAKGAKRSLTLLVRGEARKNVVVEPLKLDPPWLHVALGEPTELNDSVTQIPLSVEIPAGRPPAIYLGTDQGKFAEIILGVKNHPDVKEIRMYVKFVIGNGT